MSNPTASQIRRNGVTADLHDHRLPANVGSNGQVLSANNGEIIWKDDAGGNVDDVTVNGTSVVTNKIAVVNVPTKTSDITNDSGFIDNTYHDPTKQDSLPSVINDRYLHTNSSTGSLEWSELIIPEGKTKLSEFIDDLGSSPVHTHSQYTSHVSNTSNPHSVTAAQIGITSTIVELVEVG